MLIVIIALGSTDLLFALDSIPAIFGLTQEPYLVLTANIFALMGLRQLYFLLGGLLDRLVYLSLRAGVHPGLHRREAGAARPARERAAVHQRRSSTSTCRRSRPLSPRRHHRDASRSPPWPAWPRTAGTGSHAGIVRPPRSFPRVMSSSPDGPVRSRPRPGAHRPDHRATRSPRRCALARVADELGYQRYWLAEHHNMPAVAATNPPVLIALVAGGDRADPGRVRRRDAAQPRAAGGRRAVRAARGGATRAGSTSASAARPGTDPVTSWALRHGAGGVTDDAVSRFPDYVDDVLAMMAPAGVGLGPRAHARAARDPASRVRAAGVAARLLRLLRPARRRRRVCPTSSPTTSPAPAPPRRWRSTARRFQPSPSTSTEPRTFLTVNAVVAETDGGGRPAAPSRSCRRWWRCAPASRSARRAWSRRPRRSSSAGPPRAARQRCAPAG